MRQRATDAERRLWSRLRNGQVGGWQFRRQHPVPPYILDFACVAAMLAVEADGGQHADNTHDIHRDRFLQRRGWRVLRFWNHEILANTDGVIEAILYELSLSPHPTLPRKRGRGCLGPKASDNPEMPDWPVTAEPQAIAPAPPLPLAGEGWGGG